MNSQIIQKTDGMTWSHPTGYVQKKKSPHSFVKTPLYESVIFMLLDLETCLPIKRQSGRFGGTGGIGGIGEFANLHFSKSTFQSISIHLYRRSAAFYWWTFYRWICWCTIARIYHLKGLRTSGGHTICHRNCKCSSTPTCTCS